MGVGGSKVWVSVAVVYGCGCQQDMGGVLGGYWWGANRVLMGASRVWVGVWQVMGTGWGAGYGCGYGVGTGGRTLVMMFPLSRL
jgi:hypothetical protein